MGENKPAMALVTLTNLGDSPGLQEAAQQLGVRVEDIDADFGLVPIDVAAGLYCAQVAANRLPAGFEHRDPFQGPFADPGVTSFGRARSGKEGDIRTPGKEKTMTTTLSDMTSLGALAGRTAGVAAMATGPRTTPPGEFNGRKGYDHDFLANFSVDLPQRVGVRAGDEVPLLSGDGHVLDYEHFSLIMSKTRRIAMFTACNIDGAESRKITRNGDVWSLDGRIDAKYQLGEEMYSNNHLDRGHLVRREDPVWGTNAAIANDDTFHFTNCSPQYDAFNQHIWLGLENYILQNARVHNLQISVFTGPVLRDDDPIYRNIRIPREYWKVICLVTEERRASATAYKISQEDLLNEGMAFVFGKYKTYQVSIRSIEALTHLDFGELRSFDGFSTQETMVVGAYERELTDWRDIMI